jgi:hypothetical protein
MRFPYPLDDCECGHYRITHDSETNSRESVCNACDCNRFSRKESDDERTDVKNQARSISQKRRLPPRNVQFKCPKCVQAEQAINQGGYRSGLVLRTPTLAKYYGFAKSTNLFELFFRIVSFLICGYGYLVLSELGSFGRIFHRCGCDIPA